MPRIFLVGILFILRCVNSFNSNVTIIMNDQFHRQCINHIININSRNSPATQIGYFPSPNDDGTLIPVYMGKEDNIQQIIPGALPYSIIDMFLPIKGPRFYLYTWENRDNPVELFINNRNTKAKRYFKKDGPVKILCHGYQSSYTTPFPVLLKNQYLNTMEDVNVILIDWSTLASNLYYFTSAKYTYFVGEKISILIQQLIKDKFTFANKIHFIGHSLGAHVGGVAGSLTNMTGKLFRITGLDPAGPGFCGPANSLYNYRRLSSEDADLVDVIHTDGGNYCEESKLGNVGLLIGGKFGLNESIGQVDFYPNGGIQQPGCHGGRLWNPLKPGICSHSRSYYLLEESVNSTLGFHGCKCDNWSEYLNGECTCKHKILMGEKCPILAEGDHFLKTGFVYPFAQV